MSISEPQPIRQFVRAGAGAGKTWNLTRQVVYRALSYYEKEGEWPKTVMTTFTRKATQELKERLLTFCLKEEPRALEFVQSSSYLMITTMHGLFDSFLRRYGSGMGLASQYMIVDSQKADFWRKRTVKELLLTNKEYASLLSSYDVRRLLEVLKTYEDVYWYNEYSCAQSSQLQDLCRSLTKELSKSLGRIVSQSSSYVEGEKWEEYFLYINELKSVLLEDLSWGDCQKSLGKVIGRVTKPRKSKNNPGLPSNLDDELKKSIDQIKSLINDPEYKIENWNKAESVFLKFSRFADDYMKNLYKTKMTEASLEANDLENFSLKLVKENVEASSKFCNDWDMWFIDEFQDTSPKQIEIIDRFVGKKPCYIVGDPQQSIYLFRGSRSEVFFKKQEQMKSDGDEITQLQSNYRSQAKLLDFINDFFPFLSSQFNVMDAQVKASEKKSSVIVSKVEANDEDIEINHIMSQMKSLLDEGVSPKDICLLGRTNSALDKMQKSLMKAGFPVISHSSSNYYSRREIIDALSLLQLLINPWDDVNLVTWMRSPWMALNDEEIVGILGDCEEKYWVAFKEYFSNNKDYEPGQLLLKAMHEKNEWGLGWVLRKLLVSLGFVEYSFKIDSTGRREANLWKFLNMVEKVTREPGGSLLRLIEEGGFTSSLDDVGQNTDASSPVEPDKINLMTVHASKGLQFKYVFIPFMNKKMRKTSHANFCSLEDKKLFSFRVPFGEHDQFIGTPVEKMYLKNISQREDEESLRVLYVGMTRAEERLYMSWTGKSEKASWSSFLEDYIEQKGESEEFRVDLVKESHSVIYQDEIVKESVPEPLNNEFPRLYLEPLDKGRPESETVAEDILESQRVRWQGVVLHKLFENLKTHDEETVKELAKRWLPLRYEIALKAIEFVVSNQEIPLKEIIKNGYVEWGYQKQEKGSLVERRIDLWGVVDNELWIVDYKTGSSRHKKKAFEQLRTYSKALTEYLSWEAKINLVVVYPFDEKIEQLSL